MSDDAITCEGCGTLLKRKPQPESGVKGIRQGKASQASQPLAGSSRIEQQPSATARRDAARDVPKLYREDKPRERRKGVERFSEDAGRPQSRRGIPRISEHEVRRLRTKQEKVRPVKKHMVNWMHVLLGVIILFILGIIGGFYYLNRTPAGQVVLARMGQNASAQAYWQVGEEYMSKGQIGQAILAFEKADSMNPDNVDGLLSLGAAFEAYGRLEEAQALYVRLYKEVSPERPEAYRNHIRMLLAAGRTPEAAELMKLASEKTGLPSFRQQRDETLPKMPETDLAAGRYTVEKTVTLTSPQDYDILYIIGDGEFPKDAKLYEGPILLVEGDTPSKRLRAVCISGDLLSDPLDVTYVISLPSPDAPKASLAPDTYERAQRVWLRYPGKETDITMHYTLDGSIPDTNSPIYTGEPIYLPGGKVTLRAVAVNGKGKVSNAMEVGYKIDNVDYRMMYNDKDVFAGFALMSTTMEVFVQANGEPISRESVQVDKIPDECQKLLYSWGYCIIAPISNSWLVIEVTQTQSKFAAPRNTGFGLSEQEVVNAFRDMRQPESLNGDRSLYLDGSSSGIVKRVSDNQKSIQYSCSNVEGYQLLLQYDLKGGIVVAITHRYVP